MKEEENSPEEELNEMEASNLSDREFGVKSIRILNGMKKRLRNQPWLVWLSGLSASL